jgi:hypothetical protein
MVLSMVWAWKSPCIIFSAYWPCIDSGKVLVDSSCCDGVDAEGGVGLMDVDRRLSH